MTRRNQVLFAVAAGLALSLFGFAIRFWRSPPRLNVLLITLDTTRADRLGCYGYPGAQTPALDALARQGLLFERAYTAVPLTLPAHATLLTGLYPPEHGLHYNGQNSLGREIPTLAEVLSQSGYQSGAFVGALVLKKKFGLGRGFHIYDDDMRQAEPAPDHLDRMRRGERVVDAALAWLRHCDPRSPFFCWAHFYDPHHPYLAHQELFGDTFADRPYDAELAYVDQQVARLLADLDQRGLADRTLIIVAGDHGESLGEHGEATHSYMLYESTMKVPLLMKAPGLIADAGRRITGPVTLADLYPTILAALSIKPPKPVSGRSLLPAFSGKPLAAAFCYGETDQPYGEFQFAPLKSLTTERWKYIRTPLTELYDLQADPSELNNLADRLPEEVARWDGELAAVERRLLHRQAPVASLAAEEQRALQSLGYAANAGDSSNAEPTSKFPDIKPMIGAVTQYNAALSLMAEDNYAKAEAILRAVIQEAPDLFIVHHNLGVCLTAQGRDAEALVAFRQALKIKEDPQTCIELAKIYLLLERPADAIPLLETARHEMTDSPKPPFYWGEALRQLGDIDGAWERYREALRRQPNFPPARAAIRHLERRGR